MKKIISLLSAVAFTLALVIAPVANAATNIAVAVTGGTTTGSDISQIAITLPNALSAGATVTVNTSNLNNTSFGTGDVTIAGTGVGASFAVTSFIGNRLLLTAAAGSASGVLTLDIAASQLVAPGSNGIYSVGVIASNGDAGAALVYTGATNTVAVTATVEPTLAFSLSGNTAALGTLAAGSFSTSAVTATTATNAAGGVIVTMASTGLKSATREIGVTSISGPVADTAATDYYKVSTNAGAGAGTLTTGGSDITNVTGDDMEASQQVYSSSGAPVGSTNTTVTIGAQIAATTEAGNYSDTLTFTATGSF